MKRFAKLIGILGIVIAGALVPANKAFAASGDIKINSTNFPDEVFREYVKDFDQDKNGILSLAERKKVTEIKLDNDDLDSLKGVELFSELKTLNCYAYYLKQVDVSKNLKLEELGLYGIYQPEIDLSKNTYLKDVSVSGTDKVLKKVTLPKASKIDDLYISADGVQSVDLLNNTELVYLRIYAPISKIDVSKNPKLKWLYLTSPKISAVDVSKNTELELIEIVADQLKSLNLNNSPNLYHLLLESKNLTNLGIQKNVILRYLSLEGVQLEKLDLSKHNRLEALYIDNTKIAEVKINSDKLRSFSESGNKITKLDLANCKKLREVYNTGENEDKTGRVMRKIDHDWISFTSSIELINNVVVTVGPSDKNGGTIKGGGAYNTGDRVTVVAKPNTDDGYVFRSISAGKCAIDYSDGSITGYIPKEVITKELVYTFIAKEDVVLVADFRYAFPYKFSLKDGYEAKYGKTVSIVKERKECDEYPELAYQWYRGNQAISGATSAYYTFQKADVGKKIHCEIMSSQGGTRRIDLDKTVAKADGEKIKSKLKVQAPSYDGAADGVIQGVDTTMEYSTTKDFAKSKKCTSSKLKVKAGTYYIRYAETNWSEAGVTLVVKVPKGPSAADKFKDLDTKAWYMDAINYCYTKGIMNGISSTSFSPMGVTTRAEFVTMLYNFAGTPSGSKSAGFKDVKKGDWYEKAVNWAYASKITSGVSKTKFGPNQKITRQQAAVMLYQYAVYKKMDTTGDKKALAKFPDNNKVESWAKTALEWAVHQSVIKGKLQGQKTILAPNAEITRAECAQMIKNMVDHVKSKK